MQVTSEQTTPAPQQPKRQETGRASGLASDFETFLKMLTAQARYQDPLEPIDSTEYAAQLAQFSMVEQQVKTNDSLAALSAMMGPNDISALAGWVDMEARAATPISFDGKPISVSTRPSDGADDAALIVKDATGKIVQRTTIPTSAGTYEWAGSGDDGTALPTGVYSFAVESYAKGEMILSEPAEVYGRIIEAQSVKGAVTLIFEGGQAVPAASVTAMRAAP